MCVSTLSLVHASKLTQRDGNYIELYNKLRYFKLHYRKVK